MYVQELELQLFVLVGDLADFEANVIIGIALSMSGRVVDSVHVKIRPIRSLNRVFVHVIGCAFYGFLFVDHRT